MDDIATRTFSTARLTRLAEFRYQLRKFLSFSETEAERFGIAAQQYQLLQVIGSVAAGSTASISLLAERMILRHNSTVELVDRAEKAGLVRRVSDERDLRRSIVVLTSQGESVLANMVAAHLEKLEGAYGDAMLQALADVRSAAEASSPEPKVENFV